MDALKQVSLALATAGVLASSVAQAALNDRGSGLLYDDVLNVTWLQDANYANTSGYASDTLGRMSWTDANTWATNLSFLYLQHDIERSVVLTGWRLAANTPVGADWNYNTSSDGSTDVGYNITSPNSELSYMYYVNLGLKGFYPPPGVDYQPDWGVFGDGTTTSGQKDVGLVKNLQAGSYWSGTQSPVYWSGTGFATYPTGSAWNFQTSHGSQFPERQDVYQNAWAVRPGDVAAAVPEPEVLTLLLAGLGVLGVVAKRRRQSFGAS